MDERRQSGTLVRGQDRRRRVLRDRAFRSRRLGPGRCRWSCVSPAGRPPWHEVDTLENAGGVTVSSNGLSTLTTDASTPPKVTVGVPEKPDPKIEHRLRGRLRSAVRADSGHRGINLRAAVLIDVLELRRRPDLARGAVLQRHDNVRRAGAVLSRRRGDRYRYRPGWEGGGDLRGRVRPRSQKPWHRRPQPTQPPASSPT